MFNIICATFDASQDFRNILSDIYESRKDCNDDELI